MRLSASADVLIYSTLDSSLHLESLAYKITGPLNDANVSYINEQYHILL